MFPLAYQAKLKTETSEHPVVQFYLIITAVQRKTTTKTKKINMKKGISDELNGADRILRLHL